MDFCVYHKIDLDGKCAAAVVKSRYPDIELMPYNYGDELDVHRLIGKRVVFVDCVLQPFGLMVELAKTCELTWVDHHKTAIEEYERAGKPESIKAVIGTKLAGCELTWRWAYPGDQTPEAVRLLGRYDVWDVEADKLVMPFQYGMRQFDAEPGDTAFWTKLLDNDRGVKKIAKEGQPILKYVEASNASACKSAFFTEFGGLRCICLNMPRANSQVFQSVWNPEAHDAMLSFYNGSNRHWTISLYTAKDGVDVGELAKQRGGGGHKQAAGFQCKELPIELCPGG